MTVGLRVQQVRSAVHVVAQVAYFPSQVCDVAARGHFGPNRGKPALQFGRFAPQSHVASNGGDIAAQLGAIGSQFDSQIGHVRSQTFDRDSVLVRFCFQVVNSFLAPHRAGVRGGDPA